MKNLELTQLNDEKSNRIRIIAGTIFLIFGLFLTTSIQVAAQTSPCDPTPFNAVSRTSVPFVDMQTNQNIGYSYFDILRSGEFDHFIHLFVQLPSNTVLKAYFNGTEIATLQQNSGGTANEYWSWEGFGQNPPIARVGNTMEVTKDGQPFVTGTYRREQYNFEEVGGFVENGSPQRCSLFRANAYTTSQIVDMFVGFSWAPTAITRVSLNEIAQQPGEPGLEVATIPIASTTISGGWHRARLTQTQIPLSENHFSMLRQGLLRVVTFTAENPNGFSHMPLQTQGINSSGDFEGDGIADLAVFRRSEQNWYVQFSSTSLISTINFGLSTDKLVVGDYDSDDKADITTFQTDNPDFPGKGVWQILQSSDNTLRTIQWGLPGDIPLAVNIDRNNTSDLGIFRPIDGTWYILRMGDIIKPLSANFGGETILTFRWGTQGDRPLAGDFNNDGIDEFIAFRPSEGIWYIYDHAHNSYQIVNWGLNGDIPIAKDFDGDGRVDISVYRPSDGTWYIRSSLDDSIIVRQFGLSEDIPVPADFDKDGVADIAVFRPSNGTWYVLRSSDDSFFATQFGLDGDIPALAQR